MRAFEPKDFEAAYRLDQSCYPPGIAYSRYALREFLSLPGACAWVAEEEETPPPARLVGLVIVQVRERGRAHLITLEVSEDRRRRGLGTRLLATAEDWLREQNVRRVRLETAVNNKAAVAFWQKAGYRIVATRPRYYLDRDAAYQMEKRLSA